jgi:hypothetical protein
VQAKCRANVTTTSNENIRHNLFILTAIVLQEQPANRDQQPAETSTPRDRPPRWLSPIGYEAGIRAIVGGVLSKARLGGDGSLPTMPEEMMNLKASSTV